MKYISALLLPSVIAGLVLPTLSLADQESDWFPMQSVFTKDSKELHNITSRPVILLGYKALPYGPVKSSIFVFCSSGEEPIVSFKFGLPPNLVHDINMIKPETFASISYDDRLGVFLVSGKKGSNIITTRANSGVIKKVQSTDTVTIRIKWEGEKDVYFEYPTTGAKDAIATLLEKCL